MKVIQRSARCVTACSVSVHGRVVINMVTLTTTSSSSSRSGSSLGTAAVVTLVSRLAVCG